ncbi:MAG: iron hydrogenase small subunit [Clostridia bacterium]|nr:iron hydrogenase small subunit [Clostridia bacterium]
MAKINIKIEGYPYQVEAGLTILEAARACGYEIPSLCAYNHGECNRGSCRVCLVEATGARGLVASCVYPVSEGMEITISSPKATAARRASVELLLSNHSMKCQQCDKNEKCELLHVAKLTGAREDMFLGSQTETTLDEVTPAIVRDTSKCVLCGRCVARCANAHGEGVLAFQNRGFKTIIGPAENRTFDKSPCIMCGQCITVCPTGALMEKNDIAKVDAAFAAGKYVVVQTAPAVRAALGEEFGMKIGTAVTGKMVAALRRLGFKKVFDTNYAADLTIMEEATELLGRIKNGGKLPMITSCSPGWVNYAELRYGDLLGHLSSCKSPHEMMGAILKHYWAEKQGIDPKDLFVVSVMPCSSKKNEAERDQLVTRGLKDVDAVLTTRELGRLIKRSGINFVKLPDEEFDYDLVGEYTGAGVIFGVTGGVMEAALRTAAYVLTGKEHEGVKFEEVRGFDGIKEASFDLAGMTVNVAVAHGMKNAKVLLDDIRAGKSKYHFIEIMGCPGGCINGGGQPYVRECFLPNEDLDIVDTYKAKRAAALYSEDERQTVRQSHNNPQIKALYDEFLGEPNSHLAHELLHTGYAARECFPEK